MRDARRYQHRAVELLYSFAEPNADAMDFPDPVGPAQPAPTFPEQFHEPVSDSMIEAPVARAGGEVISLDSMRSAMVANFEQDDLDVPAFLRKRGEVM